MRMLSAFVLSVFRRFGADRRFGRPDQSTSGCAHVGRALLPVASRSKDTGKNAHPTKIADGCGKRGLTLYPLVNAPREVTRIKTLSLQP
jgi:hypothetical protein